MTYQANKNIVREKERGITMLLAILILASLSVMVFSLASIVINEIRTSGDLIRTEPNIVAAQAATEHGLYLAMRGLGSLNACSPVPTPVVFSNGVSVSTCADYYYPNPYDFNLGAGSRQDFYLYDPINQSNNPGYTGVSATLTSGYGGTVYLCNFDITDCVAGPHVATYSLSPLTPNWSYNALDPALKYQLIIVNSASGLTSYRASGTPLGLPSGVTTIKATASSGGLTRKLQTTLPQ